jgi:hypothetical protein
MMDPERHLELLEDGKSVEDSLESDPVELY